MAISCEIVLLLKALNRLSTNRRLADSIICSLVTTIYLLVGR